MNRKFVYQVGNNKKAILWCTANQISWSKFGARQRKGWPFPTCV